MGADGLPFVFVILIVGMWAIVAFVVVLAVMWHLALLLSAIRAMRGKESRLGLRSLLITTGLVAVALGLAVYAATK
jgi:hypothetical protein